MNTRYLPVDIYSNNNGYDSTNGGITSLEDARFYVEIPEGNVTLDDINSSPGLHYILDALPCPFGSGRKALKQRGLELQLSMFGGNFAWSSDSRVRSLYPCPVPVFDRIE